jgi:hypothetical protein
MWIIFRKHYFEACVFQTDSHPLSAARSAFLSRTVVERWAYMLTYSCKKSPCLQVLKVITQRKPTNKRKTNATNWLSRERFLSVVMFLPCPSNQLNIECTAVERGYKQTALRERLPDSHIMFLVPWFFWGGEGTFQGWLCVPTSSYLGGEVALNACPGVFWLVVACDSSHATGCCLVGWTSASFPSHNNTSTAQ